MRLLLLSAIALLTLPVMAQDGEREVRRIVVELDSAEANGAGFEVEIDRDETEEGRRVIIRRRVDDGGNERITERIVELRMPDNEQIEEMMEQAMEGPLAFFRSGDGETVLERMLESRGASAETRTRMRELESQARTQARQAQAATGSARRDAEASLDGTLAELFEVRAQARRERAESLRERADVLAAEADEIESALADRQSRRAELIEARRRALLDGGDSDW